ncbi:FtsP/CotA-like multicopper oxidase with cupredoxin domain [Symbiobacterium terraclitae]|uniref:FtsP/CotA-like multicopper oxidase with cupredoxin domain n=1 Tax=Symbiobacterium terraclitae TaxID=557451 RepID=A0ABS4JR38_9FIRM|nr:multicopper oxidase domain-containing protein [Symbiobacterium terraclitae]MBP2018011.1 FtsP/CotA-like multicopper oxidase with cupredoxin domain [Symbiobacterium terraclitae]
MAVETRRDFIKAAGLVTGGLMVLGITGCATGTKQDSHDNDNTSHTPSTTDPGSMDWQEMDRHHREGIEAFPAATEGKGNQLLPYTMDGDVKVFELTCTEIEWETQPGKKVRAMAYNGTVPGPVIRVTEGDKVRIIVKNEMKESTAVHWHGLRLPNNMDGVPFITQDPIPPGGSFTYEFVAKPAGTHMYHSHHNSTEQVGLGLLGAFIIDPKDPAAEPAYDREYLIVLNDGTHGYTINGKSFPATEPLVAKKGERVRIRFMNQGVMYHPMHLHGFAFEVFARDGYPLPQPFLCDTLSIAPGERWDAIVVADEPGVWAFHCHILSHAESRMGMYGMVTALIVEE